ncbi:6-aminohexanoate-dimer hydrolase [Roseivivax marinus]|uniref:6-aminohexanoate-dimer hydrolase n=1 Tax=Roseivivax marinus TaxID=1379903 RepID=W4HPV7_9RHOB|nr:hypothetical protein [Roseivivax marinus]ETW14025.1 6-aminohexanoate-dimer hydrolase [Roseivivax marinus]
MRRFWTRLAAGIVVLTLGLGAVALWKKEELSRLLAVNRLFDADRIVWNFSHMDALFETVPVPREPKVNLAATHARALEIVPLEVLRQHAG